MVPKRLHEQTIRLSDVPGETSNGVQPQQPLRGHGSGVTDQGQGSRVRGHGSGSVCIRLACSCDSSSFVARCLNTKMFLSHQEVLKFLKVFLTCPFSQGASVGYLYELTRANIPEFIWAFKEEAKN